MNTAIVGWGHIPFGRREDDVESMLLEVTGEALVSAGVGASDVDAVFLGWFNGGMNEQDFGSSLVMNGFEGLRYKPATRVENACATGSAAIYQGRDFIAAGRGKVVLVVGVEKMTNVPTPELNRALLACSYLKEEAGVANGFAGVFADIAMDYFSQHGDQADALATIAAKNHHNGCANPWAHLHKDLGYEFCRTESEKNPVVAAPLKRTDCSLVSDGAAAVVLADEDVARDLQHAARLRASTQVNDLLPMSRRDMTFLDGCARAWQGSLQAAGMTLNDLDLVETHDCFTMAELMQYEAMGLTERGRGAQAALGGWTAKDGKLPVNVSGGLKAKGHPIGATGVSMHALAAMQVLGEAGDMQVSGASVAGVFNMGGAGVANYCSIIEAVR